MNEVQKSGICAMSDVRETNHCHRILGLRSCSGGNFLDVSAGLSACRILKVAVLRMCSAQQRRRKAWEIASYPLVI